MRTTDNILLTTVGQLLGDLKRYEKKRWDYCVAAWTQDDLTLGVVGMGKDKDGDLRIEVEEVDEVLEGIWSVDDVINSLKDCGKDTRTYLAGHGLYYDICIEDFIFSEACDDEVIGCNATVIGEYDEEPPCVFTEKERRRRDRRAAWKARMGSWKGIAEGVTFLLCIPLTAYGLYYSTAAIVKHSQPFWESALYIIFLGLLLWVCIDNLLFPERNE